MEKILVDATTLRPPRICERDTLSWIFHLAKRDLLPALDEQGEFWTPTAYDEDSRRFTFASDLNTLTRKVAPPLRLQLRGLCPAAAAPVLPKTRLSPLASSGAADEEVELPSRSTTYRRLGIIGAGAYGRVFKVVDAHGNFWALKRSVDCTSEESLREESIRLKQLRHRNILRLQDRLSERVGSELVTSLVFPLAECTLEQRARARFSEPRAVQWAGELHAALRFLHAAELVHLDVKPANVLMINGRVKLGDFGNAQRNGEKVLGIYACTRPYRAPELLLGCQRVFFAMDVWAYGALSLELAMQTQLPFGRNGVEQAVVTFSLLGVPRAEELSAMMAPWEALTEESALAASAYSRSNASEVRRYRGAFWEDLRAQSLSRQLFDVFERLCVYGALERLEAFNELRFDEGLRKRARPWKD